MTTVTEKPAPAKGGAKAKKGKGGKSKKKLIIMLVLVLGLAGAGYQFFLAKPAKAGPPVGGEIVQLDPETVNLTDSHYLKIAVAVQVVAGKSTATTFQGSQAEQLIIDEFSNRSVPALASNSARKKLMGQLERKMKAAYKDEVFTIFLTQFVMQ